MIDTHCHLSESKIDNNLINEFFNNKSNIAINIGCDFQSIPKVIDMSKKIENCYYTIGIHPHDALEYSQEKLLKYIDISDKKLLAIGEIGLDYFYDTSPRDIQMEVFEKQIILSQKLDLPIVIHCRDAYGDCLNILNKYAPYKNGGVFHCYSGSTEWAKSVLKLGFYISFSGSLTFKNSTTLREVAKTIPIERLLTETDSPYMAPEGYRGKINHPNYVFAVTEVLAKIKDLEISEMENILLNNAKRIFKKLK